jgi:hypothetical protein
LAQEIESRLERSFMEQRFVQRISSEVEMAIKPVEERLSKAFEALEARLAREEDARLRLEQSFIQPHLVERTLTESEPKARSPGERDHQAEERLGALEPFRTVAARAEEISLQPSMERISQAIERLRAAQAEREEATKAGQKRDQQPRRERVRNAE